MNISYISKSIGIFVLFISQLALGQDLHFSQYYNAPMLLSPANTALMPVNDYRVGVNYRTQWGAIPVPFNTFSAYADMQLLRNNFETNWLGIGFAFFKDKAGSGDLSLGKGQLNLAYHIQLNDANMISLGLGLGYVQRSVDMNKLTFDAQWDGFTFNRDLVNGENSTHPKSSYMDIVAGVNYAYFPNENLYIKVGAGLLHINQPRETLLKTDNKLGMRPTASIDALIQLNTGWIANPSIFYSSQKGASELNGGIQFSCNISPSYNMPSQLYFGGYYRLNDAVIGLVGIQWHGVKVISTYDFTTSELNQANRNNGAFELSVTFEGLFGNNSTHRGSFNCPRF